MFLFLFLCAVKGKSAFNTGHARQFRFPFTFIQTDALRKCLAVLDLFRHPEVAERSEGKLWPVRNQKHLAALGKSFEPFRNLVEGEPADTGIHFVKNERGFFIVLLHGNDREHESGQFAA